MNAAATDHGCPPLAACPFCAGRGNSSQSIMPPVLFCDTQESGLASQVWKVKCWGCSVCIVGSSAINATLKWNRRSPS